MKKLIKRKGFSPIKIFWILVITFAIAVTYIFIPMSVSIRRPLWPLFVALAIISLLLGAILIFLTIKKETKKWSKRFLLLTGFSVIGMPVSIILHNFIYGLFIYLFGQNFWEGIGLPDEPLFFIIAIIVCPVGFLVGTIGNITLLIKQKRNKSIKSLIPPHIKSNN